MYNRLDTHLLVWSLFFFFQAEDGIRDRNVTGVQTCALPISGDEVRADKERSRREPGGVGADQHAVATHQRRRRPDQPGGADESIEPPGHGAQQGVTRHSKSSARAENLEAEPRPAADGAHPAAASGSPPKRRSRARNSATAAASSAAPKSGHV